MPRTNKVQTRIQKISEIITQAQALLDNMKNYEQVSNERFVFPSVQHCTLEDIAMLAQCELEFLQEWEKASTPQEQADAFMKMGQYRSLKGAKKHG
jgi:hypothetical protein